MNNSLHAASNQVCKTRKLLLHNIPYTQKKENYRCNQLPGTSIEYSKVPSKTTMLQEGGVFQSILPSSTYATQPPHTMLLQQIKSTSLFNGEGYVSMHVIKILQARKGMIQLLKFRNIMDSTLVDHNDEEKTTATHDS